MILLSQDDVYSSMIQDTIGIEIEKVREGRRWGFKFLAYFQKFENDGANRNTKYAIKFRPRNSCEVACRICGKCRRV